MVDFNPTDDQRAFQDMARKFAMDEMLPNAEAWDRDKIFPKDTLKKAAELGLAAIYVDPEHGGCGLNRVDAALIMEQLAYGCPSTAAFISIHNMANWMIDTYGSA
ncbi:MAG: acyl-CoA dehydrogenase family protein, partial [Sphingomonadales bacterium]|nr:acyl-CoA dehydrogenase family protein [Sphingomonadales bacterium]